MLFYKLLHVHGILRITEQMAIGNHSRYRSILTFDGSKVKQVNYVEREKRKLASNGDFQHKYLVYVQLKANGYVK